MKFISERRTASGVASLAWWLCLLAAPTPVIAGEPCGYSASMVNFSDGGSTPVTIQWGGEWPYFCPPADPQITVDGNVIEFTVIAPYCALPGGTSWCEQATTESLPAGQYDIVTRIVRPDGPVLESVDQGTIQVGTTDYNATVTPADGGGIVSVQWGGIGGGCLPTEGHVSVDGNAINFIVESYGASNGGTCDDVWCPSWDNVPWSVQSASGVLPPGAYDVTTSLVWCDGGIIESVSQGALNISSPPGPPIGDDFNDGEPSGWSGGEFCGAVMDGELITFVECEPNFFGLQDFRLALLDSGVADNGTIRCVATLPDPQSMARIRMRHWCVDFNLCDSYTFVLDHDSVAIERVHHLASTTLAETSLDTVIGQTYMMEARAVGADLSLKVWELGETEPGEPQVIASDSTYAPGAGRITLGGGATFDNFTFTPTDWQLIDDFTGDDLDGWTAVDTTASGTASAAAVDGRAHITTRKAVTDPEGLGLAYDASGADPQAYANGTVRTIVTANDTNASIFSRVNLPTGEVYSFTLSPTAGIARIARTSDFILTTLASTPVDFGNGDEWYLQASFIGDQLSLKVWPTDEPEPTEPLLTATDAVLTSGGFGLVADTPEDIGVAVLDAEFGDVWFKPADKAVVGDLDGDGEVGVSDLLQLLSAWGQCTGCAEDLDADDAVGVSDLLMLLAAWS